MKNLARNVLFAVIVLVAAGPARAYDTHGFWPHPPTNMRASNADFSTGSDELAALRSAVARWNSGPGDFEWNLITGDTRQSRLNLENEIWIESGPGDAPAETVTSHDPVSRTLITADVIIYESYDDGSSTVTMNWTNDTTFSNYHVYGGSGDWLQPVFIHELGHALGLDHEDGEYNVMGDGWTHVQFAGKSTLRAYVGEDAADAIVDLYGLDSSAGEDLSVVHWKYSGSDGEYSTHRRTAIFKLDDTHCSIYSNSATLGQRFTVTRGHNVKVEFTYENSGRSTQSVDVGIYLSTDRDAKDSSDILLATYRPTLGRADVWTHRYQVTIPTGISTGNYYVIARIDDGFEVSETEEKNNSAWIPVRVQ